MRFAEEAVGVPARVDFAAELLDFSLCATASFAAAVLERFLSRAAARGWVGRTSEIRPVRPSERLRDGRQGLGCGVWARRGGQGLVLALAVARVGWAGWAAQAER